jgi:hypothetical protein
MGFSLAPPDCCDFAGCSHIRVPVPDAGMLRGEAGSGVRRRLQPSITDIRSST